jgi:transcriptional regulator with XRE-family HTH domain
MPARKKRIRHAPIVQAFADRLKAIRTSRNVTQRDLATHAHLPTSYVSKLEAGGAAPGIDLLERLAIALQVSITELLPKPSEPMTTESSREQVKALFDKVIAKAGAESLLMLNQLLTRLAESSATNR